MASLDPFAAAGNDGKRRQLGVGHPHIVLNLRHMLRRGSLFRERPRQHELGLENGSGWFNDAVQRGSHPAEHGVPHPPLNVLDHLVRIALVPVPVEVLGRRPKLNDQVAREVFRLGFAPFFPPEAEEGGLVGAHDDSGV